MWNLWWTLLYQDRFFSTAAAVYIVASTAADGCGLHSSLPLAL
jgi:hypothetical protein